MLELPTTPVAAISPEDRRKAWLEDRKTAITGTDISAIFGLSRFSSPIQVQLDKRGLSSTEENQAMAWGRRLERPILEAYADITGEPIQFADSYQLLRCPSFPLLGASLDARRLRGDLRPIDAKNTRRKSEDWGEPGSDVFPIGYQLQLAVQMAVTDTPCADLAVLFSGQEFATYTLYRDLETEAMIKDRAAQWWDLHIIQGIDAEMDGSDSSSAYLKSRFARATEVTREATPDVLAWVEQRRAADLAEKEAKKSKSEAENLIKAYLGEAKGIPGIVTWTNNRDGVETNWEAVARELATYSPTVFPEILDNFTSPKPGARVMRFTK